MSRKALGKGLDAIFSSMGNEVLNTAGHPVHEIELKWISPNPFQPRREFNDEEIQELADSIREKGLLQPILLRKHAGGFQLIAGERRFRAVQRLGRTRIPATVREKLTDRDMMEMALIENIQRVQLNAIEEAQAFEQLIVNCGLTHEELSKQLGKSRSAITNALRLLKLDPQVKQWIREGRLSAGHGRALLHQDPSRQQAMARRILDENLNVRATEKSRDKKPPSKSAGAAPPSLKAYVDKLRFALGTKVVLKGNEKKGVLEIHYFGKEDLENFARLVETGSEAVHAGG